MGATSVEEPNELRGVAREGEHLVVLSAVVNGAT